MLYFVKTLVLVFFSGRQIVARKKSLQTAMYFSAKNILLNTKKEFLVQNYNKNLSLIIACTVLLNF